MQNIYLHIYQSPQSKGAFHGVVVQVFHKFVCIAISYANVYRTDPVVVDVCFHVGDVSLRKFLPSRCLCLLQVCDHATFALNKVGRLSSASGVGVVELRTPSLDSNDTENNPLLVVGAAAPCRRALAKRIFHGEKFPRMFVPKVNLSRTQTSNEMLEIFAARLFSLRTINLASCHQVMKNGGAKGRGANGRPV